MIIGCPSEIKNQEYRVGMTPAAATEAIARGHSVVIQKGAGVGSGFEDAEYVSCLLYTSPSPRDKRQSRMPSSA